MGLFYDMVPFTLLDFPSEMACIVWFAGCNMRCVYCHNPEIVTGKNAKDDSEFFSFLAKRKGLLTGVVFSGGEATLNPDLPAIIAKTKEMGFKVKLDTNGARPKVVQALVAAGLLDYVALDYKAPLPKAAKITGQDKYWDDFRETLLFLIQESAKGLGFEVRTTVHTDFLDEGDVNTMIQDLQDCGYRGVYYLQNIASVGEKTLGDVRPQERELDREKLLMPQGFSVSFRNFSDSKK